MSKASTDKLNAYTQEVGLYINDTFPLEEYTAVEVFAFLSTLITFVLNRFYLEGAHDMMKVFALSLLYMSVENIPTFSDSGTNQPT